MTLLTPKKSVDERDVFTPNSIRLVSTVSSNSRARSSKKLLLACCILGAFAGGFALSFVSRPTPSLSEARIQVSDFQVAIPEGETIVTVYDRQSPEHQLAQLKLQRHGPHITGVPVNERKIEPRQHLSIEDASFLRHELEGVISANDSQWDQANKIRVWLAHSPHRLTMPGLISRVPRQEFEQMKRGEPVLCGNLADIYVALCDAAGLTARQVGLSVAVQNGLFGVDTHVGAEVWLPEFGGWVYQDPTFNAYWEIDGNPASALAIHDAVMAGKQIDFAPRTKETEGALRNYYLDPRLYFRHISYEYKPGGSVLYFADKRLEPLSLIDKNWIHTGERIDIQRYDGGGNLIAERRTQVAPGIFLQLLGNDLFVRDRRERSPGIRVRSTTGTVQGCAYIHQRAEDLGIFSSGNLARNPSFRLTSRSDTIADEWSVVGPIEAMTVSGGQALAALAGGKLWQRVQVRPDSRYLLYARVSVSRGLVNWSIADAGGTARSTGTIEPERISEVVSDVVESKSGYLDVGFEVPSGGSFRVIDVIVADAPKFDPNRDQIARSGAAR
jgi:hypothetical protein